MTFQLGCHEIFWTNEIPYIRVTTIATFADDTAVLTEGSTVEDVFALLQRAVINLTGPWNGVINLMS